MTDTEVKIVRFGDFIVHYAQSHSFISFEVYPCVETDGGVFYCHHKNHYDIVGHDDIEYRYMIADGIYRNHAGWKHEISFVENIGSLQIDEIKLFVDAFERHIEPFFKKLIRDKNPNDYCED